MRTSCQASREVDGVAHDGVRAPRDRTDVAGEDLAAIDAGAERQVDLGRHDLAQRTQHPLVVVARCSRGRPPVR